MNLDATDLAILRALQLDARRSNKELAAIVGLAPSSTHLRVKRLERDGALTSAHAVIPDEALGIGLQALIFVRLALHARASVRAFWTAVTQREEVVAAWYVSGDDDIVLHVAVRDNDQLRDLVLDHIPSMGEVGRLRTELVFDHVRKVPPMYRAAGKVTG